MQTDDNTIVFKYASAQPGSDWILSLFYTVPVPKAKDDKQNCDFHPVSSGPYKISSYTPDKSLTLVATPTGIRRLTRTARPCRTASSRRSASTCLRSASG